MKTQIVGLVFISIHQTQDRDFSSEIPLNFLKNNLPTTSGALDFLMKPNFPPLLSTSESLVHTYQGLPSNSTQYLNIGANLNIEFPEFGVGFFAGVVNSVSSTTSSFGSEESNQYIRFTSKHLLNGFVNN